MKCFDLENNYFNVNNVLVCLTCNMCMTFKIHYYLYVHITYMNMGKVYVWVVNSTPHTTRLYVYKN